ncbi:MAG: aromatic ring-hydroxylating dioxygenase subunit alpha [Actinomycetota bacterium]
MNDSPRSAALPYPINPQRALPASAYRAAAHDIDLTHIWRREWVFVATADALAEAGDFVAVDVGGQPIIVLRNQRGQLTAMSNMCAHRGTPLVDGAGNAARFQCPYHAWTYDDAGRLLAAPFAPELDRDAHCLATYRAEEWHGLVFATLNADAPSVADRLAHVEPHVIDAGIDDMHHWPGQRTVDQWAANWKLVMANAMESYHLFKVHPTTLEPYSPTAGAYYVVGNADATVTGGSLAGGGNYLLLSIPPNFVAIISDRNYLGWEAVYPTAHDASMVVTGSALPDPPPDRSGLLGKLAGQVTNSYLAGMSDFLVEDRAICERVQRGVSGEYAPGPLVAMEHIVVDFHHFLDRRLHGSPVPPVRTAEALGLPSSEHAATGPAV